MKSLQTIKIAIFGIVLILIAGAKILAAGGDPDTTFKAGATGFGSYVQTVAVQTDGRVLIGGGFSVVNGRSFNRLARLNANGSIDESFRAGATYVVSVRHGKIQFNPSSLVINANEDALDINFIGEN